jgi:hypothetical protein
MVYKFKIPSFILLINYKAYTKYKLNIEIGNDDFYSTIFTLFSPVKNLVNTLLVNQSPIEIHIVWIVAPPL